MTADPQYSTLGSPFRSTGAFTEVEQEALLPEESEVLDGTTFKILGKAPDRRGTQILRAGALTLIAGRTTLLALLASTASARAEQPPAPCPGNTTVEMRVCAAAAWGSALDIAGYPKSPAPKGSYTNPAPTPASPVKQQDSSTDKRFTPQTKSPPPNNAQPKSDPNNPAGIRF